MHRVAAVSLMALVMSVLVHPFVAAQSRPSSGAGTVRPLCQLGCGGGGGSPGPSEVTVTPYGQLDTIRVGSPPANATVTFWVSNIGTQYTD